MRVDGLFLSFWALIRLSLQVLGAAGTAAAHCGGSQGRLLVAAAVACPACGLSVPSGAPPHPALWKYVELNHR